MISVPGFQIESAIVKQISESGEVIAGLNAIRNNIHGTIMIPIRMNRVDSFALCSEKVIALPYLIRNTIKHRTIELTQKKDIKKYNSPGYSILYTMVVFRKYMPVIENVAYTSITVLRIFFQKLSNISLNSSDMASLLYTEKKHNI